MIMVVVVVVVIVVTVVSVGRHGHTHLTFSLSCPPSLLLGRKATEVACLQDLSCWDRCVLSTCLVLLYCTPSTRYWRTCTVLIHCTHNVLPRTLGTTVLVDREVKT
jgi:hypothetical protein